MVTSKTRTSAFSNSTLWLLGAAVTASNPSGKSDASSFPSPRTCRAQIATRKAAAALTIIFLPSPDLRLMFMINERTLTLRKLHPEVRTPKSNCFVRSEEVFRA